MGRGRHRERTNEAWNRLIPYVPMLRSYARRVTRNEELAREVVQEACLRILRNESVPADTTRYEAWCRGVARNVWMAERRKSAPNPSEVPLDSGVHEPPDPLVNPEQRFYANERFAGASAQIDGESVELLVRRYVLGERITDLAGERGQRPPTLRMQLLRLRSTLRKAKRRRWNASRSDY